MAYQKPKLERFGSFRELTLHRLTLGENDAFLGRILSDGNTVGRS